jgi:SAM-dependent methyltransferase
MPIIAPRFDLGAGPEESLHLSEEQKQVKQTVSEHLQSGRYRFEEYRCPCGAASGDELIARIDRYGLPLDSVVCLACGTVRFNPYLDNRSVADFYTSHYQQMYGRVGRPQDYFRRQIAYGRRILNAVHSWLRPGVPVFEVGCGAGGSLKIFQDLSYHVHGCEYSSELVAFGQTQGVASLTVGAVEELALAVGSQKADLIFLHHVFEHLTDPADFLTKARQLLSPNGRVLIVIPDISQIDRFPYPGGNLRPFLHIGHKTNFTLAGLEALGARLRMKVRVLRDVPLVQPELWVEMSPTDEPSSAAPSAGAGMVRYLQKTERLHQLGFCHGQMKARVIRLQQAAGALPKRVVGKARQLFRQIKKS